MRVEDRLQQGRLQFAEGVKKHIFDWIAAIIVVALIAASLDVFGLIDFNKIDFIEFLISWFPYFAAAILLNTDLYKKGVFVAKNTEKFGKVIDTYSDMANQLSGQQIRGLYSFCDQYNEDARKSIQIQLLRSAALTFDEFDKGDEDKKLVPLKILDKEALIARGYTKQQVKNILAAKRVKVKGISVSMLLNSINAKDATYVGEDERSLRIKRITVASIKYALVTLLLSVVAMKNISAWGWTGLILTLFKVAYLFAGCYMSYFTGYDDVTINLVNHFTKKIDIFKMYLNYEPAQVETETYEEVEITSVTEQ